MPPLARLKPGHVRPVWTGHPWVYAQALERIEGGALKGDEIDVVDPKGQFLGRGFYSPSSAIPVRILSRKKDEALDAAFFRTRIAAAISLRHTLGLGLEAANGKGQTTGYRLVHAEGDGVPGLIVDVFGDVCAVQLLTAGMAARAQLVCAALMAELKPSAILDRTPARAGELEGFSVGRGLLAGTMPDALRFVENGLRYELPLEIGQKTGYYFDQRALRARVATLCKGKSVLDSYSFVGSFGMAAAHGGALRVRSVDTNAVALEVGAACAHLNGVSGPMEFVREDAKDALKAAHGAFDVVLVDPPRLASNKGGREAALAHYTHLADLGARATRAGGIFVLSSCSSAIGMSDLMRALAHGAIRANMDATVLERHTQGADHPVPAAFPEGLYLKALIAKITPR